MTSSLGVLLVGHGTRDVAGTNEFFTLADRLAETLGDSAIVRPCLLEFQKPDIAEAYASLMQSGCRSVIVAPLLLFAAGHAKSDIPGEVESARAAHENLAANEPVQISYAKPITRQAAMIDAVRSRLIECLGDPGAPDNESAPARTAIVMVGRGSRDPCATSDMRVLGEVVVHGRFASDSRKNTSIADEFSIGHGGSFTTFYAMAEPRLPATLEQVAASDFERIIVYPHLLFSGRLYDAIGAQVNETAARHPDIRFQVSAYLGPTSAVARAIAARIQTATEAATGTSTDDAPLDARRGPANISG